ncbi:ABC transporter permease [Georgenia faecalis]|uniref:ABC transporter permease n=1 Tax=Georgenia faecalis TaxID=2483799 RepID=A0ABV9D799_9MICO|nr:ABC transporter permease [Georgenia faecalis]
MSDENQRPEQIVPIPTIQGGDPGAVQNIDPLAIEEDLEGKTDKSYSQGQLVLRRFLRHKAAMVSLAVLVFVTLLAYTSIGFGPFPGWWKHGYTLAGSVVDGGKPTLSLWPFRIGEHPFGQDNSGKDFFALVMRGTQRSLIIAFVVGIVSTIVGTVIGALAGYFRGWVEAVLMRITDLFIVIPLLVLAAVLGQMTGGNNIWLLAAVLGIVTWTGLARLVRGEVLSLREREFVAAARAVGTSPARIVVKHILPNTLGTIIVSATLSIASAILLETSLSFLGFGVNPPDTSLGVLISTYQNSFTSRPWLFWWPGIFILAIALSVNFIGDGLRDAFDPRQNRKKD